MKFFRILYSLICYGFGVAALVYLILFIGDIIVPVTINQGSDFAPNLTGVAAILLNFGLLALWGYQHSLMASPKFKNKWTKIVPASVERSTYLVFVAIFTAILVMLWAPLPHVIWDLSGTLAAKMLWVVFFSGWVITLLSTFMLNHFHLFGLQQAYQGIQAQQDKTETFRTPMFYKLVRHPIMTGVFIGIWAAPVMTTGRLVLAIGMTAYIFLGVKHEEKTLIADLGQDYLDYKKSTPSIIPWLKF